MYNDRRKKIIIKTRRMVKKTQEKNIRILSHRFWRTNFKLYKSVMKAPYCHINVAQINNTFKQYTFVHSSLFCCVPYLELIKIRINSKLVRMKQKTLQIRLMNLLNTSFGCDYNLHTHTKWDPEHLAISSLYTLAMQWNIQIQ